MGLNLVLYDLRHSPLQSDERFDYLRHAEDYAFVEWLHKKNAIYKLVGDAYALTEFRQFLGASDDEDVEQVLAETDVEDAEKGDVLGFFRGDVFARPKDFAAARDWVHSFRLSYQRADDVWDWDRKRYSNLLDLLEREDYLWLYVSR